MGRENRAPTILKMNITIITFGSRGDVQPFLPLSLGLMSRGHNVTLAAPARFKDLIEEHGITFFPLAGDPEELSRRLNDAGYNFIRQVKELMSHAVDIGVEMLHQTEEACRDADLIIHTFAHAGPMFEAPIPVEAAEVVERDGFAFRELTPGRRRADA